MDFEHSTIERAILPGRAPRRVQIGLLGLFCAAVLASCPIFPGTAGAVTNVSMSVEENPYNKVAAQLQQKEKDISERESLLNKYEKELQRSNMTLALFVLILFLLIMLNYYLDYHRKKLDEEKRPDNVRYLKL